MIVVVGMIMVGTAERRTYQFAIGKTFLLNGALGWHNFHCIFHGAPPVRHAAFAGHNTAFL
jgi:hypothetical protein